MEKEDLILKQLEDVKGELKRLADISASQSIVDELVKKDIAHLTRRVDELEKRVAKHDEEATRRAGQIDGGKKVILALKWICAIGGGGVLVKLLERVNF